MFGGGREGWAAPVVEEAGHGRHETSAARGPTISRMYPEVRAAVAADVPTDFRAPGFDVVFQELRPHFENALLAAHNAAFDMSVLRALLEWAAESGAQSAYLQVEAGNTQVSSDVSRQYDRHS